MRWLVPPTLSLLFALSPLTATARFPGDANFVHESADVESVVRDARGRETKRTISHFDAESAPVGSTVIQHVYRDASLTRSTVEQFDAEGHLRSRSVTDFTPARESGLPPRAERTTRDAAGALVETESTEHERDASGLLSTTTRRDARGELLETRYTISRQGSTPAAGRDAGHLQKTSWSSSDTSIYGADGEQKLRVLIEWRGPKTERWTFTPEDDVLEHEVETRVVDAQGRTTSVSSDTTDGRGQPLSAREEAFAYTGPAGALGRHVITWYDGAGVGTRRRTETTLFKGGKATGTRVSTEVWQAPATDGEGSAL